MLNLTGTYTLTPSGINLIGLTEKCSTFEAALSSGDVPELKSTQVIDKYADFIITAISIAVDKAILTSKSGCPDRESNLFRKNHLR